MSDALVALLGRDAKDPDLERAMVDLGIRNRPELRIDPSDADGPVIETQAWVKNSRLGIELGFDDEAAWQGHDEIDHGKGSLLLTQLYLFGHHDRMKPFPGPLPAGLLASDSRSEVRRKLARWEDSRRSYIRDTWDAPSFRLTVEYGPDDMDVRFVLCGLREPPQPPLPYGLHEVPGPETVLQALGRSADDEFLLRSFGLLGMDAREQQVEDDDEADFRHPYGLSLGFTADAMSGRRPPVLTSATFYAARELGARQWPGSLPAGLAFEMSPDALVDSVGREADVREDDDFSGFALWHERDHSLHVLYDTMQNRLARISLYAPGSWARWHEGD